MNKLFITNGWGWSMILVVPLLVWLSAVTPVATWVFFASFVTLMRPTWFRYLATNFVSLVTLPFRAAWFVIRYRRPLGEYTMTDEEREMFS